VDASADNSSSLAASASATEETGATPVAFEAEGLGRAKESPRSFLQSARRNLTQEEAQSPAGVRWLTHEVERLDQECAAQRSEITDLRGQCDRLKDQYSDKRVEVETVKAASNTSTRNEALSALCLAGGSAGLGACTGFIATPGATGLAITGTIISAVLIVGSIGLRAWK
jgi:hypothetical protein